MDRGGCVAGQVGGSVMAMAADEQKRSWPWPRKRDSVPSQGMGHFGYWHLATQMNGGIKLLTSKQRAQWKCCFFPKLATRVCALLTEAVCNCVYVSVLALACYVHLRVSVRPRAHTPVRRRAQVDITDASA
eukprot:6210430-Pleurochrysis_carterae.AAC.2